VTLPTIDQLICIALADTDFIGDLTGDRDLIEANVCNSIWLAADIWADVNNERTVPQALIDAARVELTKQAHAMLDERAEHTAAQILDEIEAGDRDDFGRPIRFPRYVGV
jgi:hypothetical protein